MKKLIYSAMVVLFALLVTGRADAQAVTDEKKESTPEQATTGGQGKFFKDTNNDGVCDNFKSRGTGQRGVNFADADQDGICDNRNNKSVRNGDGNRYGQGCGKRNGMHLGNCKGKGQGIR